MRFLVTGAAGFVGSNLCKEFESQGHELVGCDNFFNGKRENLEGFRGELLAKGIGQLNQADISGLDAVFHEAAISDPTVKDEKLITETNFTQSLSLLKLCNRLSVPFIYASSSAVYGNTNTPNREFEAEKPHNAYARSKLMLDLAARELMGKSQIVGLRYFNIYGPGEALKGKSASMVHHFLASILAGQEPVIFGDGTQKRDFVYIKDVVRANMLALRSGKSSIVNVGSGRAVEFRELVSIIATLAGRKVQPVYKPNPYANGYQFHTEAELSNAGRMIGYRPEWKIEDGVRAYLEFLKRPA